MWRWGRTSRESAHQPGLEQYMETRQGKSGKYKRISAAQRRARSVRCNTARSNHVTLKFGSKEAAVKVEQQVRKYGKRRITETSAWHGRIDYIHLGK